MWKVVPDDLVIYEVLNQGVPQTEYLKWGTYMCNLDRDDLDLKTCTHHNFASMQLQDFKPIDMSSLMHDLSIDHTFRCWLNGWGADGFFGTHNE